MKHTSFLRILTAAVLSCTLCCTGMTFPVFSAYDTAELPARFDWRDAANLILKGLADNSIDFSEAHLIWFTKGEGASPDTDDPRFGSGYNLGMNACDDGGHHVSTIASLSAWQGVVNEIDVPPNSEKTELDESVRYKSEAHLQNAQFWAYNRERDSQYMKQLLAEKGPLSLAYFQNQDCRLSDKSGYYNPEYSAKDAQSADVNGGSHAVMVAGLDDNYSKEYFNHEYEPSIIKFSIYEGETVQILRGDMDRDGRLTAVDLSLMKQTIRTPERSDLYQPAADWNDDSEINAEDARGLLNYLLTASEQEELKIRLTGSTADKRDEAFRRQMQDAVTARVPDFDFLQFTFETHGMTYLHNKNDATEEIGKEFYFWVYYQDYLLDPEHYEMRIRQYYDGTFETDAEFLIADIQEKLAAAVAAPRIAEANAVSAAMEYAAAQALPDLPSVLYQPSEQFGEKPQLLVYSLEEGRLAYQISDPQCNRYELGTGQSKILCEVAAKIYVDAFTGEVLENRFMVIKSVS